MFGEIQPQLDLFGIPWPSNDRNFPIVIVIHILLSLTAVICGLGAILKNKTSKGHYAFGKIYYWSILAAFVTVITMAIMRWPYNNHLFLIGLLTVILVFVGRRIARIKRPRWSRLHTVCMGGSYILLITGFYVDNGKNLPFWKLFPQWFFWIFPAVVGIPIILYVLKKHPLNRITNSMERLSESEDI